MWGSKRDSRVANAVAGNHWGCWLCWFSSQSCWTGPLLRLWDAWTCQCWVFWSDAPSSLFSFHGGSPCELRMLWFYQKGSIDELMLKTNKVCSAKHYGQLGVYLSAVWWLAAVTQLCRENKEWNLLLVCPWRPPWGHICVYVNRWALGQQGVKAVEGSLQPTCLCSQHLLSPSSRSSTSQNFSVKWISDFFSFCKRFSCFFFFFKCECQELCVFVQTSAVLFEVDFSFTFQQPQKCHFFDQSMNSSLEQTSSMSVDIFMGQCNTHLRVPRLQSLNVIIW